MVDTLTAAGRAQIASWAPAEVALAACDAYAAAVRARAAEHTNIAFDESASEKVQDTSAGNRCNGAIIDGGRGARSNEVDGIW